MTTYLPMRNSTAVPRNLSDFEGGIMAFDSAFLGLVILFGIPGNAVTIIILTTSRKLRKSPTSIYLAVLAACDSMFLASMGVMWVSSLTLYTVYTTDVLCKTVTYLTNVTGCLSTWLVVVFTIERYFVVVHPLHRLARCSKSIARRNVLLVLPWPFIIYSCSFIIVGTEGGMCAVVSEYQLHAMLFHSCDLIIILFVPFFIIVSANIRIGHRMLTSTRRSGYLSGSSTSTRTPPPVNLDGRVQRVTMFQRINTTLDLRRCIRDVKTTKMLVIISCTFLILNFPHNLLRIRELVAMQSGEMPDRTEQTISVIFMAMYNMNFAINFVLYSMASSNFRSAARECLFRCFSHDSPSSQNASAVLLSAQWTDNMVSLARANLREERDLCEKLYLGPTPLEANTS